MKVAIVHDSVGEFGGAERVVLALSKIWPEAPIYTSFVRHGQFLEKLKGKRIITSWANNIPFFATKLHSPLRFLAPLIWGSFDFSEYDVVISSSSWYITKGWGNAQSARWNGRGSKGPIEFCYCHTPPRWLYGFDSPANKKNPFIKAYIAILAHFMRIYDFERAQKVDYFIANSENIKKRIEKFYRREPKVIYPPIETKTNRGNQGIKGSRGKERKYYLIVSRITGGKGIEMAVKAANRLRIPLKIAGSPSGYSQTYEWIKKNAGPTVELLGYVPDGELGTLYARAKAFLALQRDEDFGMTLPEALSWGTPVVAYNGGGYPESVTHGKTGVLFDEYSVEGLIGGIRKLGGIRVKSEDCRKAAQKFSSARFKKEIQAYILSKFSR
ncbi:MAG: glycosyltransferase [Candidatus Blackburnbacteria bacterium]|nr:glycosyltransferase [Candidatus Blackburnbacteria bacterium]